MFYVKIFFYFCHNRNNNKQIIMRFNITKLIIIEAYLLLMFISTWATVEAANRLVNWSLPIIWIISIIFFAIASLGMKLIFISFDYSQIIHGRFKFLFGGIVLLALFWLGIILPTNAHTFFYKSTVEQICLEELKHTETVLQRLKSKGEELIQADKLFLNTRVQAEIKNFRFEVTNLGNVGTGRKSDSILVVIESLLGNKIQRLQSLTKQRVHLDQYIEQMDTLIREQLSIKQAEYDSKYAMFMQKIDNAEYEKLLADIRYQQENLTNEPTEDTKKTLITSFALIDRYVAVLHDAFPNEAFEGIYATPKTIEIENIYQTWQNYFRGDYKDKGFSFWMLVAFLIDFAAFIIFFFIFKYS